MRVGLRGAGDAAAGDTIQRCREWLIVNASVLTQYFTTLQSDNQRTLGEHWTERLIRLGCSPEELLDNESTALVSYSLDGVWTQDAVQYVIWWT